MNRSMKTGLMFGAIILFAVWKVAEYSGAFGLYVTGVLSILTLICVAASTALLCRDIQHIHKRAALGRVLFWLSLTVGAVLVVGEATHLVHHGMSRMN